MIDNKNPCCVHIGPRRFAQKGIHAIELFNYLNKSLEINVWFVPALIWSWSYWFDKKNYDTKKDKPDNGNFSQFIFDMPNQTRSLHPTRLS